MALVKSKDNQISLFPLRVIIPCYGAISTFILIQSASLELRYLGGFLGITSGQQAQKLSNAIRRTFSPEELDRLLYYALDMSRADITLASDYQTRAYDVLRSAEAQGWMEDFIASACTARPRDAALHEIAEQMALTSTPNTLESIVQANVPFVDISSWRERLGALEACVCRIELTTGQETEFGTGFLAGPNLVMTNYHVVQALIDGRARPDQVVCRFDYRQSGTGSVLNPGTEYRLHRDYLVVAAPPSAAEVSPGAGVSVPVADELDFAVLRLDDAPGAQTVARGMVLSAASVRGWVDQISADSPSADETLFVLQHPDQAPLKLAFGTVAGFNTNATRLLHRVNTERGSSGSPCLNGRLHLVALHQSGNSAIPAAGGHTYNRAIPIKAICDYLAKRGEGTEVFPVMTWPGPSTP